MNRDLTGKVFGKLKVISKDGKDKYRNRLWECLCECGNTKEIITNSLNSGRSLSCGCLQVEASRKDIPVGSAFGKLKVLEFSGIDKQRSLYRCKCDCGKETIVQAHRLRQKITTSCGCARQTHGMSRTPEYSRLAASIRRSRLFNAEGSHTLDDIQALFDSQEGLCYYCKEKLPPYHVEHKVPLCRGGSNYKENLCLACPPCNHRKHTKTDVEFLQITHEYKLKEE